ncbi:hypothetical protein O6H91_03G007100 [Diphasiastrum complanatum]|uniref:Uncharacterized protein n=1 Tax=Diphasiastrum complanatum TaxID=34168 RepID=A0ACC2E382_DIPCM|nr:hypothetical protein O6H91_03G007100 [Diphasiastrum complanatum]
MAGRRQGSGSAKDAAAITLTLLAFAQCVMAATHTVGGTSGWNLNVDFQTWAAQESFKVGDTLLFSYSPELHSVFQVSEADYKACTLFPAIKNYQSGSDSILLTEAITYYFVCGTPGHCTTGMAVAIPVSGGSGAPAPSPVLTPSPTPKKAPVPSPSPKRAPAPAPAPASSSPSPSPSPISPSPTETVPSPSPSETSPSSPPSPSPISPSSLPSQAPGPSPPKNGASRVHFGAMGLLSAVLLGGFPFLF